jgi:hypothetical protein
LPSSLGGRERFNVARAGFGFRINLFDESNIVALQSSVIDPLRHWSSLQQVLGGKRNSDLKIRDELR